MSAPALPDRIEAARAMLTKLVVELDKNPGKLPSKLDGAMRALAQLTAAFDSALDIYNARVAMRSVLRGLDGRVDTSSGLVDYAGVKMPFWQARLLAVQSYVATSWSLADLITGFVSGVYCQGSIIKNRSHPAKLWEHFIKDDASTSAALHTLGRECFGLPVAVSYLIRNLFVHDGGLHEGKSIFEGPLPKDRFALTARGWDLIARRAQYEYKVQVTETRAPEPWPWPASDVRDIFDICEREIDDLLGILLGTACTTLRDQTAFLLGVI